MNHTTHDFLSLMAHHAPGIVAALRLRPRELRNLPPQQRDGLATQLRHMAAEIDATLAEIAPGRPGMAPPPPTPLSPYIPEVAK